MAQAREDDSALAAAVLLGVEAGLFDLVEARRIVDVEIVARPEADPWLIDASLAPRPADFLHALRERAGEHPMLDDPLAHLDAAEIALERPHADIDIVVSSIIGLYPYFGIPADLRRLAYALDEEATCAHGRGGIPDPEAIETAVRKLLAAARGRSRWKAALEAALAQAEFGGHGRGQRAVVTGPAEHAGLAAAPRQPPRGRMGRFAADLMPWQRAAAATMLSTSVWTLLYFLFLRTPLPSGSQIRTVEIAGLLGGVFAGAVSRAFSRRVWPLALGAAIGIILGGSEAYVSDTAASFWQRVAGGLVMGRFALALWIAIIGGGAMANVVVGRLTGRRTRT